MIATPPISVGAVQVNATCVFVVLTLSLVKNVGTPGTTAATIERADVSELTPMMFLAWTLKL